MQKMIVIDGNSLLFRAYYATAYGGSIMRTKAGVPTNALFAFSNMIGKILGDLSGDEHLLVAWDTGEKTLRHKEDETYKANRPDAPIDLVPQFALAREFLKALGIKSYETPDYEADDIAGSIAKRARKDGFNVELYTSDQDFLQLVDENIVVQLIKNGSKIETMDVKGVLETYEMTPLQIIDYKGLRGDPSDNIPGVPGVGKVIGTKLIKQYGDVEGVIAAAPNLKGKVYENIVTYAEQARFSKKLATIITDVEIPLTYDDLKYKGYHYDEISSFCQTYELRQFMNRLSGRFEIKKENASLVNVKHITSSNEVDLALITALQVVLDGEDYHHASLKGVALANKTEAYFIPTSTLVNDLLFQAWLSDEKVKKNVFDAKLTEVTLARYGLSIKGISFDLLLASYLLDASLQNDPKAILAYYDVNLPLVNETTSLIDISGLIAHYVSLIKESVLAQLEVNDALKLYLEIELPLSHVLAKMEIEGFPLDKTTLLTIGEDFRQQLDNLTTDIYALAGEEFNISSPKQVAEILFDKLNLPDLKKRSTAVGVLAKLEPYHPIVGKILDYRKYAKLVSTYIDGLVEDIQIDGKLHTTFNQALTTTGRLSSTKPNLQNISVRDEQGREIRKAFFYDDPNLSIVSFDYAQIELRIMAALAKSPRLINAFKNGEDIHAVTAEHLFKKERVSSLERQKAKAVNFGIIYGISDWGLSEQISSSVYEAKEIKSSFYEAYPEISTFTLSMINNAMKEGYVSTLLGRRRYLPGLNDQNYQVREFAKRAAMNAPIQGTAADLIKLAMVKIDKFLSKHDYQSKLVLQIHDELIFVMPDEEIAILSPKIKEIMENALELDVPLVVAMTQGKSWFDCL